MFCKWRLFVLYVSCWLRVFPGKWMVTVYCSVSRSLRAPAALPAQPMQPESGPRRGCGCGCFSPSAEDRAWVGVKEERRVCGGRALDGTAYLLSPRPTFSLTFSKEMLQLDKVKGNDRSPLGSHCDQLQGGACNQHRINNWNSFPGSLQATEKYQWRESHMGVTHGGWG